MILKEKQIKVTEPYVSVDTIEALIKYIYVNKVQKPATLKPAAELMYLANKYSILDLMVKLNLGYYLI